MSDVKIINDPVFGFIKIPKGILYGIVEHPLFQRLNRINQLGLASVVYPGARHTRFQHSLGAFHLMSEAIQNRCNTYARHRSRPVLTRSGEYADSRHKSRGDIAADDGGDKPIDERTA